MATMYGYFNQNVMSHLRLEPPVANERVGLQGGPTLSMLMYLERVIVAVEACISADTKYVQVWTKMHIACKGMDTEEGPRVASHWCTHDSFGAHCGELHFSEPSCIREQIKSCLEQSKEFVRNFFKEEAKPLERRIEEAIDTFPHMREFTAFDHAVHLLYEGHSK